MNYDIEVDACYVIGTALLYKNSVNRELLNRVEKRLSCFYDVDLSEEKVNSTVTEWKDFFRFNENGNVILTKEGLLNKGLVRFLFADGLEPEIYDRVFKTIMNIEEKKIKILRFPK